MDEQKKELKARKKNINGQNAKRLVCGKRWQLLAHRWQSY